MDPRRHADAGDQASRRRAAGRLAGSQSTASSRRTASGRTFPPKSQVSSLASDTPRHRRRRRRGLRRRRPHPVVGWPTPRAQPSDDDVAPRGDEIGEDEFTARAGRGGGVRYEDRRRGWTRPRRGRLNQRGTRDEDDGWSRLPLESPANAAPLARGGHSATLVRGAYGAKIIVFGGEDRRGRLLDDVHVVDLQTMRWSTPDSPLPGAAPTPRAGHVAASFGAGAGAVTNVFVFGGVARGLAGEVSGELFVLDTMAMTWRADIHRRRLVHARTPPAPSSATSASPAAEARTADGRHRRARSVRGGRRSGVDERRGGGRGIVARRRGRGGGRRPGARVTRLRRYDGARYSADVHVLKQPQAGRLAMTKTKILSPVKTDPRRTSVDADASTAKSPKARISADVAGDEPRRSRELEHTKTRLARPRALAGERGGDDASARGAGRGTREGFAVRGDVGRDEPTAESRRPKGVWGSSPGTPPDPGERP